MLPGAQYLGKTLGGLRNLMMQDILPIAIKKRKTLTNLKDRLVRSSMNKLVLKVGDRLLLETSKEKLETLNKIENVILLQEFDNVSSNSKYKRYFSLGVLLLVIGLAASGALSIMVSALTGVCILLLTNNLDLTTVYKKSKLADFLFIGRHDSFGRCYAQYRCGCFYF
ncbi:hypothetical protein ACU8V7_15400 [Zobellia nedashkovskayae]